jgi:hypothetical protein
MEAIAQIVTWFTYWQLDRVFGHRVSRMWWCVVIRPLGLDPKYK